MKEIIEKIINGATKIHVKHLNLYPKKTILELAEAISNSKNLKILNLNNNFGTSSKRLNILIEAISKNQTIEDLQMSFVGLSDKTLISLCKTLCRNKTIKTLNLSGNHFNEVTLNYLAAALILGNTVQKLYLNNMELYNKKISKMIELLVKGLEFKEDCGLNSIRKCETIQEIHFNGTSVNLYAATNSFNVNGFRIYQHKLTKINSARAAALEEKNYLCNSFTSSYEYGAPQHLNNTNVMA